MRRITSLLRTLSFVLAFIGIAMVIRRALALRGLIRTFAIAAGIWINSTRNSLALAK